MVLTLSTPLSLYFIPAVWLTAFLPVTFKTILIHQVKGLNNVAPRTSTAAVTADKNIPPEVAARIMRMEGAHLNGNENFPIWIAAVLAGNIAGLDNRTMNVTSLIYIGGRILYNYIYFNQVTEVESSLRSAVYFSALSCPMYLLFQAAAKMKAEGRLA
ncbi:hypothetical protein FB45DRAFT_1067959 [Roridomyces roridus]|uniref:MAPEG family protein n=1 Tax=Roridomyces roridus TaxID=1738132 RepID=A0AAD7B1V4_9AGAR|nr:hypothetical protein FB45DRAFT_1067959 [Roridomyces roridus]